METNIAALEDRLNARLDALTHRFETMLWKHSAGVILGVLAVGGPLLRFAR